MALQFLLCSFHGILSIGERPQHGIRADLMTRSPPFTPESNIVSLMSLAPIFTGTATALPSRTTKTTTATVLVLSTSGALRISGGRSSSGLPRTAWLAP